MDEKKTLLGKKNRQFNYQNRHANKKSHATSSSTYQSEFTVNTQGEELRVVFPNSGIRSPDYSSCVSNVDGGYTGSAKNQNEDADNKSGATSSSTNQSEPTVNTQRNHDELGVAFSGGGIRSAAFCSGVLRRLLDRDAEPDYLSCVSGGGYTGSAYVQWKYRKGEPNGWTDEFFDNMRKNANYFFDCQFVKGCCCLDFVILCALLFFVAVITPIACWGSFAFPIALIIKHLYGQILDGTLCSVNPDSTDCVERNLLFSISFSLLVVFHLLEYCWENLCEKLSEKKNLCKMVLKLGQLICGATFAFTFLPWFINEFLRFSPLVIQVGIIVITAFFWFFVPVLRKYSSLVILIYSYSYVVYWHLYERKLLTFEYTKERFEICFIVSVVILAVFSILGDFPLRLVHIYNRWRLQKAFYKPPQSKICCYCYDIFPGGHCPSCFCASCVCPPKVDEEAPNDQQSGGEITLQNLGKKVMKPEYLSNVVVNGWRKNYDRKYNLLTMSSKGISVIDQQPEAIPNQNPNLDKFRTSCLNGKDFAEKLKPSDIKLSSAMAMSAAALSPYLGKHEAEEQNFTHILTLLGMEMATNLVYDMGNERNAGICHWVCLYIGNFAIFLLIGIAGIVLWTFDFSAVSTVVITAIIASLILVCILISACFNNSPTHSWLLVHLPIYRFVNSLLNFIHHGSTPPAMLHLSDGGHFENYGLLPLLKLRLPRILVADGSHIESEDDYAKEIIQVMEYAREILDCSFTAMDGGDVLTDIKNKYVHPKDVENQKYPRMYKFKVLYSETDRNKDSKDEGHIVLIAPRSPSTVVKDEEKDKKTWKDEKENLDSKWGEGPTLTQEEIESVSGFPVGLGCCDCWSCCSYRHCCESCLSFPRHTTGNQFFTPRLFTVYHREGYRACMECDDFLKPASKSFKQPKLMTHV